MKTMKKYGIILMAAGLIFTACQNPVDIVEEVTKVVMEANDRYIEVTSVYPASNASDINASAVITVDFDRDINPDSFTDNVILYYGSGEDNEVEPDWLEYDSVLKRLTIDAAPWLNSNETITVTVRDLVSVDGSEMKEEVRWSFQTNNEAAFDLTIDASYGNIANHDSVPVSMEFSTSQDIWYYLSSDSTLTVSTVPDYNPSTWTEVTSSSMTDTASFSTEGASVPLYLWVYDASDGGAGLLTTNGKTEAEYLLVDLTEPIVSAGSEVYTNAAHTFTATATDDNGIASYAWSGPAECSFSPANSASTEVASTSEGTKTLTVTATDGVGNEGTASVDMIWDTTSPAAPGTAPDLDNAYDSGASGMDNITNVTSGLVFQGVSEAFAEIELYSDSSLIGTATADGTGNWVCTASEIFSEGENTFSITACSVDRAGNKSDSSPALSLVIDTVVDDPSTPDLNGADDSGQSNTDNITRNTTLTFNGTAEPYAVISYEEYEFGYSGTVSAGAAGDYTFELTGLSEGYYEMETHQVDLAGNSSTWSETLGFTVDTTAPSGDFILPATTNDNSVTASITYTDDSGIWKYNFRNDGDTTWSEDMSPSSSETLAIRNNSGTRQVYFYVYDNAGNVRYDSDTTNFLRPVYVRLEGITVDASNESGAEEWFWAFLVNGEDSFSRSPTSYFSYDIGTFGGVIGYNSFERAVVVPEVFGDLNSATPYTTVVYVDVSSDLGTAVIEGGVGENDGKINQLTGSSWFHYISSNVRNMSTMWPKYTDPVEYNLTDGTLTGIGIAVKYWAGASYAANGS